MDHRTTAPPESAAVHHAPPHTRGDVHAQPRADTPASQPPQKHDSFLVELAKFGAIALIIVLPVRMFIAQPYIVAGASMEPTFESGQYLIADRLTYRFDEPDRGDVIIFRYPKNPATAFIKRIIALPGETIQIQGERVLIFSPEHPDGIVLTEDYLTSIDEDVYLTETLGAGEYFVMGDNRAASSDSRTWGVLERDLIIGRAVLRLLPVTEVSVFPGRATPETAALDGY